LRLLRPSAVGAPARSTTIAMQQPDAVVKPSSFLLDDKAADLRPPRTSRSHETRFALGGVLSRPTDDLRKFIRCYLARRLMWFPALMHANAASKPLAQGARLIRNFVQLSRHCSYLQRIR
jgi:hypothetical protein